MTGSDALHASMTQPRSPEGFAVDSVRGQRRGGARRSGIEVGVAVVLFVCAMGVTPLLSAFGAPPPGVGPSTRGTLRPDIRPPKAQIGQAIFYEIAANEARLGRALATPRIIRIVHLGQSERFQPKRLDGSDAGYAYLGGPGWLVEAVGTFISCCPDERIDSIGMHGFFRWDDSLYETGFGFIPCWTRQPTPPGGLEGMCKGVP